ncbi:MAG TPA: hypothetical protein VMV22_12685 [Acidimicrobiales bacterium]|nr:hypothetical protein [Acidimicrobiales bacterium]
MRNGPRRRAAASGGSGSSWLRLGFLLALGEVAILAVLAVRPATGAAADHLAASNGPVGRALSEVATVAVPTTTLPAIPTTTAPPVPTTTVPAPTTTTTAPPAVPPTPPAAPAHVSAPSAGPSANISPQPDFLQSCSGAHYDGSPGCVSATVEAIANARGQEGLPPLVLPSNWAQLGPDTQLFVATNLERTARGLPPMATKVAALDQAALQGAANDTDPGPPAGFPYSQWGSNWAGALGNPLEAVYFWMYDDGVGSANIDCTPSNTTGCWGHRQNILLPLPCQDCVMGTGWLEGGYSGDPSLTEILVETSGSPATSFTWQQELPYLS